MATEDILINDGDGFVSLSELAAEQVDVALPISSTDGTVTLDSPAADTFTISTDGEERVKVDSEGRLGVGASSANVMNYFGNDNPTDHAGGSCYGVYADGKCQAATTVYAVFSSSPEADARPDGPPLERLVHYQTYYDTGGGSAVKCEVKEQIGLSFAGNQFTVGAKNYGVKSSINTENGKENYHLYLPGNAPSMFGGDVQTSRIVGPADTDASIELGANATISTGGAERVKVDPNGRFLVGQNAGANPNFDAHFHKNGWNQLVVESVSSNAQIKMIADTLMFYDTVDPISRAWRKTYYNIDTAASINTLTVDTSGNLEVAGQVRTSRIVGPADTDASLELGANAAIVSPVVYLGSQTGSPEGTATVMPGDSVGAGRNLVISSGKPKAAADEGSAISLATAEGNGVSRAPATRMYIASTGNVGIDNVTPDERLVVGGNIRTNRVKGFDPNPMIVLENQQATLLDSTEGTYTATDPNSIATKQTVDDKIQVMTTAEYNALAAKNPTTLYCLTD